MGIPHSRPQPLTSNRRSCCPINDIRPCNLIPFPLHNTNNPWYSPSSPNNISMMTRHRTRRHISRPPHTPRAKRSPIRDNPFYHLRSVLLPRILLSLLPRKPCTHPRARRLLAT